MSSTKSRWVSLWEWVICIPWNSPLLAAFKSALLKPSATNKKSKGERGQPWRKPFSEMKKGEANPFIRIAKETEEMHAMIHLMKGTLNPRWVRSSLMYD